MEELRNCYPVSPITPNPTLPPTQKNSVKHIYATYTCPRVDEAYSMRYDIQAGNRDTDSEHPQRLRYTYNTSFLLISQDFRSFHAYREFRKRPHYSKTNGRPYELIILTSQLVGAPTNSLFSTTMLYQRYFYFLTLLDTVVRFILIVTSVLWKNFEWILEPRFAVDEGSCDNRCGHGATF